MATTAKSGASTAATRRRQPPQEASTNGDHSVSAGELEALLAVLRASIRGERGLRLEPRRKGLAGELARAFNELAQERERTTDQIVRVSRAIGREGKLTERAQLGRAEGTWKAQLDSVNELIDDLVRPTTEVARVIDAVADGDLSQKIQLKIEGQPVKGEFLRIGTTVNAMVDQLSSFADEVTRVAREVGTEGKLGGQAQVKGVSGTWKDLTDNVNQMASNLTAQVRNIADVTTAVANGDLTRKITVDVEGEVLELKNTINTMVDQLSSLADEVTRVAREAGSEGKLGGQAQVKGVSGTWKDLTDNVNFMVSNLTTQVRGIAKVVTAVANGDLEQKFTIEARGEVAALADTINAMIDTLRVFADQVTGVAREVGTEGVLGGQADVPNAAGTWKALTDNVNSMANNLTTQVRNIAFVTTAVANGDLSRKITVEAAGEVAALAETINTMVDQLSSFADEVTRVAREVGTEGRLGGQAQVEGVSGTWRGLTESVNFMASNLTTQVRNIADVTTAVANGDLSRKITVEAAGEVAALADTINAMVDRLNAFAAEVTRVAREVGTEGRLGGQANVEDVSGVWRDLTENVNTLADNLSNQVRNIAEVTTAVATGDLTRKITVDARGEILELKDTINTMVDQLSSFADEVTRVAREVGSDGVLGGQADVRGVSGTWKDLTDSVNSMAQNLTTQVRNIAEVTTAVASGDLTRKITVEAKGEVAALAETINTMVDQLSSFADEVTRVAREVGTEGILGGQADVKGVSGTWKDLTDSVNGLSSSLTTQVRNIAEVTTAVANGDLTRKITVDVRGEVLELKNTINTMVDQLSAFAAEVTRVAKEVGTEGILGGQANVSGVSGTWKDLTDNVNQLAGTLTTQLRAIAEVSTAVTSGDLTRSITVDAEGEVAELKDNINQMITNLRETTDVNARQDWLNTNMARFSGMLQGQRDVTAVSRLIMSQLTPLVGGQHGAFFMSETSGNGDSESAETLLRLIATYGYKKRKSVANTFAVGEALVGQAALESKSILITQAPQDYITISSGLGEAAPVNIIVFPILFEDQVMAVVELASFTPFSDTHLTFLEQLSETIGVVLNTITATMRTEELLEQSQSLTQELQSQSEELQAQRDELSRTNQELEEQAKSLKASEELLQSQQEELQQTNEELEEKAQLLAEQNARIEQKNAEVEAARIELEEKAEQLAVSSKYKSEFLANMSHELRTPLNSLLILAKLLADNEEGTLSAKQVEFARTIYNSGSDLLGLINDVLDLSKVEAGKMDVHLTDLAPAAVADYVERSFRPVADQKGLEFAIEVADDLPAELRTDEQRLQQILKNLLSNAFKFTEHGTVRLTIGRPGPGTRFTSDTLRAAGDAVLAFAVADTGIGIPEDKLKLIFEAFQQADGTTNRRFGGTGLGLSISREIARLLGGEIQARSTAERGSTFTLYLPAEAPAPPAPGGTAAAPVLAEEPLPEFDPELLLNQEVDDDRAAIGDGDRVVLIVEDDLEFARVELDMARARGFKGVVATRGDTGLALAHEYRPDAIILDVKLPVRDGWQVLEQLKRHPQTRHIPVHVVSGALDGKNTQVALRSGAVAVLEKPVEKEVLEDAFAAISEFVERGVRSLLVVDDDEQQRHAIEELIGAGDDIEIVGAGSSEEALELLERQHFDCMVLDLKLPKMSGFKLLERVKTDERFHTLPVIVYTGRDLTQREETRLKKYAETIIVKDVRSPERLLDETALFLHRVESRLPADKRRMLEQLHSADAVLHGRKVLVADDDVRTVFALASVLERQGVEVLFAENGQEAVAALEANPDVDLVLMDVMMPELDGYEATRRIRSDPRFATLPIISLTAKAMKGDREKCIESGASDYIPKPVDTDQLISLLRVWLYR